MKIGSFICSSNVVVALMAGVTNQPFRNYCRRFGAEWVVSEMVTSDAKLWGTVKKAIAIPVIANGDITGPLRAQSVLNITGTDGVMIGRPHKDSPGCRAWWLTILLPGS